MTEIKSNRRKKINKIKKNIPKVKSASPKKVQKNSRARVMS